LPPKSKIESRSNRHLTQSRLQVTGCTAERYCVLHVVCQGPEHFLYRSAFLYDVYTVAELRSFKVAQFSDFGLSSHTKPVKRIPSSDQPTAQELHRRMILIFHVIGRRSKGVPSGTGDFLRLLVKELGTPKLAQNFAYGKRLYPYRMHATAGRVTADLDQRCLKTRNSKDGCTFSSNVFAPPLKSPQNPILGDLSMQNLLYR